MAYVKISTFAEGDLFRVRLANGTYEQYVLAKHNYESGLNSEPLAIFVSTGRIEQISYSSYGTDTVSWGESTFYNKLRERLESADFQARFPAKFLNDVETTVVPYNDPDRSSSNAVSIESKFFIPSATELAYSGSSYDIAGKEGGSAFNSTAISKITKTSIWTRTVYNLQEEWEDTSSGAVYQYYGHNITTTVRDAWTNDSVSASLYYNLCFCMSENAYVNTDSENEIYGNSIPVFTLEAKNSYLGVMTSDVGFAYNVSAVSGSTITVTTVVSYGSNSKTFSTVSIPAAEYGRRTQTISISDNFIRNAPSDSVFTVNVTASVDGASETQSLIFSTDAIESTPPYIGDQNGLARHIHKFLLGVNGIARKVRKMYIGDASGVARIWFKALPDSIVDYSLTTSMMNRKHFAAATVGRYAIWGGGVDSSGSRTANVQVVDRETMSYSNATQLTSARSRVVGASDGTYAYITSGGDGSSRYKTAFCYNSNLSMTSVDLNNNHVEGGGASVGNYALIAGGEYRSNIGSSHLCTTAVDVISRGTTGTAPELPNGVAGVKGCTFNNYAIFAGGYGGEPTSTVTGVTTIIRYSSSLTQSTLPAMAVGRHCCGVAASNRVLIVAGGGGGSTATTMTYEMYSRDFTKIGGTYAMDYGGYMYGGFVNVKSYQYPDGMICFANTAGTVCFNGTDGSIVVEKSNGIVSDTTAFDPLASSNFGDETIIPVLYNANKLIRFKESPT